MQNRTKQIGMALDALKANDNFKILLKDFFNISILDIIYNGGSNKVITEEINARYIFKQYLDTIENDFKELIKNEK